MTGMQKLIDSAGRIARDLWLRGWVEGNAGNLSYRLRPEDLSGGTLQEGPWHELGAHLPDVAGRHLLLTATGSFFRELAHAPEGTWASSRSRRAAAATAPSGATGTGAGQPASFSLIFGLTRHASGRARTRIGPFSIPTRPI